MIRKLTLAALLGILLGSGWGMVTEAQVGGGSSFGGGTLAVTQSGTWDEVGINDSGNSLTVDAPVGTPVFVRLSDGSSAIATLPVSLASVPSHAVTNAGTFAVQSTLQAGSAIVGQVGIDQTTPGTTNGVQINAALPAGTNAIGKLSANSGVDIGDVDVTSIAAGDNNIGNIDVASIAAGDNNIGNVDIVTLPATPAGTNLIGRVQIDAQSANAADSLKYTSVGSTEDEHAVKATAGVLYSVIATNTNAAVRYFRCANLTAANTAPGTSTPIIDLAIPGAATGAGFSHTFPVGLTFSTALTCWLVTGAADSDVAEVAANEIKVLYSYK